MNFEKNRNNEINDNLSNQKHETSSEVKDSNDKELSFSEERFDESNQNSELDFKSETNDNAESLEKEKIDPYEHRENNNRQDEINKPVEEKVYNDNKDFNQELSDPLNLPLNEKNFYNADINHEQELDILFNDEIETEGNIDYNKNEVTEENSRELILDQQKQSELKELDEKNELDERLDLNSNPNRDIENTFEYVDYNFQPDSPVWQETANRYLEYANDRKLECQNEYDECNIEKEKAYKEMTDYINDNNLSKEECQNDQKYLDIVDRYNYFDNKCESLNSKIKLYDYQTEDISKKIDPEMQTTFKGFNGSDFKEAYDGCVTNRQGRIDPTVQGNCGINTSISMGNQQNNSRLNELDGIELSLNNGKEIFCTYKLDGDPKINGATNFEERKKIMESQGLNYEPEYGAYKGNGKPIDLDSVAERFNNGESCGLMLKGEDLHQEGLANRKNSLSDWWNGVDNKSSNHATTICGFSYHNDGKVAGVWINDTGGFNNIAGNHVNRIYIDKNKFEEMQYNTKHFCVEYARKKETE